LIILVKRLSYGLRASYRFYNSIEIYIAWLDAETHAGPAY